MSRLSDGCVRVPIRFIGPTSIGSAERIYDSLYCARGQAENLIKLHKTQLASTAPVAARRSPIRSASSFTPPPIGSSSPTPKCSGCDDTRS
jgi:hypothetical protein